MYAQFTPSYRCDVMVLHMNIFRAPLIIAPALFLGAGLVSNSAVVAAEKPRQVVNCLDAVCLRLTATAVDSDGDGFTDADETHFGTDPHDRASHPPILDVLQAIADGTLPSYWLEPSIDLVTITPKGFAITSGIGALYAFGMLPVQPSKLDGMGLTVTPPGFNLGGIGALNWDIHASTSGAKPPMDPKSLYASDTDGGTASKREGWDPVIDGGYSQLNAAPRYGGIKFDLSRDETTYYGKTDGDGNTYHYAVTDNVGHDGIRERTTESRVQNPDGSSTKHTNTYLGNGNIKSSTYETTSPAGVKMTSATTTADGKTTDNMTPEEKEKAAAEQKRLDDQKAAAEKKKQEEQQGGGGYYDPNADTSAADPFAGMTPAEVQLVIELASGAPLTHVGDNGLAPGEIIAGGAHIKDENILANVIPGTDFIELKDVPSSGPETNTNYDPNHPTPFPFTGPVRN
jgi:hypothetical protein